MPELYAITHKSTESVVVVNKVYENNNGWSPSRSNKWVANTKNELDGAMNSIPHSLKHMFEIRKMVCGELVQTGSDYLVEYTKAEEQKRIEEAKKYVDKLKKRIMDLVSENEKNDAEILKCHKELDTLYLKDMKKQYDEWMKTTDLDYTYEVWKHLRLNAKF